jgi:hypothetical protein
MSEIKRYSHGWRNAKVEEDPRGMWVKYEDYEKLERDLSVCQRKLEEVIARYAWAANELLACDYGDNEIGQIGWRVYGWRGGPRFIYGRSIDAAIDGAIGATRQIDTGAQ